MIYKLRRRIYQSQAQDQTHSIPLSERIERYVDACPPAISGQFGRKQTFLVAIALVRGFDLSPEMALPFLERYSQRCQPPWTDEELRHKLRQADNLKQREGKPPLKPRGYLL
jgi:hypothetical protein